MKTPLVCAVSRSISSRVGKSTGLPAAYGTMMRTGPEGQSCADTGEARNAKTTARVRAASRADPAALIPRRAREQVRLHKPARVRARLEGCGRPGSCRPQASRRIATLSSAWMLPSLTCVATLLNMRLVEIRARISLHPDSGGLYHALPSHALGIEKCRELVDRAALGLRSLFGDFPAQLRILERGIDLGIDAHDHRSRRSRRGEQRDPGRHLDLGQAHILGGGKVGKLRCAAARRHSQC